MKERSNSNKPPPRPVARRRPGRKPNGPQGCIGLKARLADDHSAKPNDLEITYISIEAIREYKNHARVHDKKALAKTKALLSAHGQIVPIVIDENGVILDGVLRALFEMGHDQVRVIIVRNRDPAALKAIRLALNRLPQDAKWDDEKLRAEFSSLIELDYDVTLTGFETAQINMAFAVDEPGATAVEVESAKSLTPPDIPVVKLGDKWRLGRHVVACGDARDEAFLAELVGEAKASAAILDLPYNLPIAGFVSGLGKKTHREFAMASGEMTPAQFTDFLAEAIKALKRVLMPGAVCYYFLDWRHTGELLEAAKRNDLTPLNLCIWVKTNPGMASFYRSAHEFCFVYKQWEHHAYQQLRARPTWPIPLECLDLCWHECLRQGSRCALDDASDREAAAASGRHDQGRHQARRVDHRHIRRLGLNPARGRGDGTYLRRC